MKRRVMLSLDLPAGPLDLCIVPRVLRADDQSCQMIFLLTLHMFGPKSKRRHNLLNRMANIATLQLYDNISTICLRHNPIRRDAPADQTPVYPDFSDCSLRRIKKYSPTQRPLVVYFDPRMREGLGAVGELRLRRQTRSPRDARTGWKCYRRRCPSSRRRSDHCPQSL